MAAKASSGLTDRAYSVLDVPKQNNRFVIMEAPSDENLGLYLKNFADHNVTSVVKACPDDTYDPQRLRDAGVQHLPLVFNDGETPPPTTLAQWNELVKANKLANKGRQGNPEAIAVHCVAGLGRAPLLVAIALINDGMEPMDAINFIRSKRRGCFNERQVDFLMNGYKKPAKGCVIM